MMETKEESNLKKQLQSQIDTLEEEIALNNIQNKKISKIRNLNIKKYVFSYLAPYVLAGGISLVGSNFITNGNTPFIRDKKEIYKETEITKDNLGNITEDETEKETTKMEVEPNKAYFYTPIENENGWTGNEVHVYEYPSEISGEEILKGNINEEDLTNLVENYKEKSNNPKEEKYRMIKTHEISNYYVVKEDNIENLIATIIYLLSFTSSEILASGFSSKRGRKFYNDIERIKRSYPNIGEDLKQKLKLRKENYNLLMNKSKSNINILDCFSSDENHLFSKMSSKDLLDFMIKLNDYPLELRPTLLLPSNITLGLELECENVKKDNILKEFQEKYYKKNWILKPELSLDDGIEVNSPILIDNKENWQDLQEICNTLNYNSIPGENAGAHIHVGSNIIQWDKKAIQNLLKMWAAYENVIFRFSYGEYLSPRPHIRAYAPPISKVLYRLSDDIDNNLDDVIAMLKVNRHHSLNIMNSHFLEESENNFKKTVEFRCPNYTLDSVVWQNNVNFFAKLLLYCKSPNFREDIVLNRLNKNKDILSDFNWYQEIFLEEALELCDLIFDNDLDKIYFLRQYLKNFDRVEDQRKLIKAKSFTKSKEMDYGSR